MRRIIVLFMFLIVIGGGGYFLMGGADINKLFGVPQARFVVALRDIPPFSVITEDSVTLRDVPAGTAPPEGAILDVTGQARSRVLQFVINKASPEPIGRDQPIRMDKIFQFDLLQRTRGVHILLARERIEAGTRLDPSQFRTTFRETSQRPRGSISGSVGDRVEQIFENLPSGWASTAIDIDQPLTFQAMSFNDPNAVVERPQEVGQTRIEALDLDAPLPVLPRSELLARLSVTPGAFRVGDGVRGPSEVEAVGGIEGNVDVFISASRGAMRMAGFETHTRLFKDMKLNAWVSNESPNERPVFWLKGNNDVVKALNLRRAQGAVITVVPSGRPMPSAPGAAVMCARSDVCYRGLTVDTAEEVPMVQNPQDMSGVPSMPTIPGPGRPQGGGPWQGGVGGVPTANQPPQAPMPPPAPTAR